MIVSSSHRRHSVSAASALVIAALGVTSTSIAQTTGSSTGPVVTLGSAPVTGVAVGDGVHQSQPVVNTFKGSQTPLVGVGALSGNPGHGGSIVSISVLNTNRLLGVSAGPVGSNGVNVANPTGKPVFSGLAK